MLHQQPAFLTRAPKYRFSHFPAGSVTVGGEIGHHLDLTVNKILHHTDVEDSFAKHYAHRLEHPTVPGGFTGYGLLLDAVVKACMHGIGGEEMRLFKEKHIDELLATQTPDGRITIFADKAGLWENHDQAYLLQALILDYTYFHLQNSLDGARKLTNYLISHKTTINLGLETAFFMLWKLTGDQTILDYLEQGLHIHATMEEYDHIIIVNTTQHVYTWLARALAQAQYAQEFHEMELLEPSKEALRRLFGGYASISGTCTGGIKWGEFWTKSQVGLGQWGETCVSAYWLRLLAKLSEFTDEPLLSDAFERILYNAFFAAQSEDGLHQRYFTPFNEPGEWYAHDTYCCPNNLRRMMFELPDSIFLKADNAVAVNLYHEATLNQDGLRIQMHTAYPQDGNVSLEIEGNGQEFDLLLRIPIWCQSPSLVVDGETVPVKAGPGWAAVHRVWAGTVPVQLKLPMVPCFVEGLNAQIERAALICGPLVYAVEQSRNPLNNGNVEALTIQTEQPVVRTDEGFRVPCIIEDCYHTKLDCLFTRFCSEHRTQTYFPYAGKTLPQDFLF